MTKNTIYSQRWQRKNPWKHKYIQAKGNAKYRGIPFLLTFDEWQAIWLESGKWEQRGWRKGTYCMARFGDQGAYEIGNVRICLNEENRAERNQNYPLKGEENPAHGKDYWASASDEERARRAAETSKRLKGVPQSLAHREKRVAAAIAAAPEISTKMKVIATGRRRVIRGGRSTWAHPGDVDYPVSAV